MVSPWSIPSSTLYGSVGPKGVMTELERLSKMFVIR